MILGFGGLKWAESPKRWTQQGVPRPKDTCDSATDLNTHGLLLFCFFPLLFFFKLLTFLIFKTPHERPGSVLGFSLGFLLFELHLLPLNFSNDR